MNFNNLRFHKPVHRSFEKINLAQVNICILKVYFKITLYKESDKVILFFDLIRLICQINL